MHPSLDFKTGLSPQQMRRPVSEFIIPVQTAFSEDITVGELLSILPDQEINHYSQYIYTIDSRGRLVGVLSTRQILFSPVLMPLKELAKPHVTRIESHAPLESCLKIMAENELLAIPVTDNERYLLGLFEIPVAAFENMNKQPEGKELFQVLGLSLEQHKPRSFWKEYRCRMPWLGFNIAGGLACAYIGSLFHQLLDDLVVIAMFIPLVLTLGESIAMQSMVLSLEFIEHRQVPWKKVLSRLKLNGKAALLIGLTSSAITSLAYYFFYEEQLNQLMPLIAISTSIIVCMLVAAQIGALTPASLRALKLDPKVAAGPIALMITDVCVTICYLLISTLMLMS